MKQYNNFYQDLAKEQDTEAQEHLQGFYKRHFSTYEPLYVDYNTDYGMFLQRAGVDRILLSKGKQFKQLWIQEKIAFNNYPNFLFEYQKKSGAEGWGIAPEEKSEYLIYYMNKRIYLFHYESLKQYLRSKLDEFIDMYYLKTDNHNIVIPKRRVFEELNKTQLNVIEFDEYYNRVN